MPHLIDHSVAFRYPPDSQKSAFILLILAPKSEEGRIEMQNLTEQIIARSWADMPAQGVRAVTGKADVTQAIYGGLCPIEVAGPYRKADLPSERFPHSMSAGDLDWVIETAAVRPRSFLEIGSFWGDTAILAARRLEVPVVCIDTWLGGLGVWTQPPPNGFLYNNRQPDWRERLKRFLTGGGQEIPPATQFFRQFASNVDRAGVTDKITCIRLPSPSALRLLRSKGLRFDAIYVDGSHDYSDVYIDIVLSLSVATDNAVIFGDDFQETDVADAVRDYCRDSGRRFDTYSKASDLRSYWMIRSGG
jgi:predicted O-methyltransferase YrrM